MNISLLEFNFADFELLKLLQCNAKMFTWYSISRKQSIRKITPMRNFRLLQYIKLLQCKSVHWNLGILDLTIQSLYSIDVHKSCLPLALYPGPHFS